MCVEWLYSAEIRWFFPFEAPIASEAPPQLPADVLDWFRDGRNLSWPPEPRTDRYLLLPGCTSTGVKLREGRFEVKAICGTAEPVQLAPGVSGWADRWVKWSYGGEAAGLWTAALSRETVGWLDVTKWRLLRAFDLSGGRVVEVTDMASEDTVELTAVRAQNHFWWTLGLEATGAPESLDEKFRRLVDYFFGRAKPPLVLDNGHSAAYPGWLDTLT